MSEKDRAKIAEKSGSHLSRNPGLRTRGFGIGGGYERPLRRGKEKASRDKKVQYGPLPHAGYYGTGVGARPFRRGESGFGEEMNWYRGQYGEQSTHFGGRGEK